ncbi:echinoderm microtubule-associated protein-like 2, partial [Anguilla rostrata]|uniref:echinoderm microtubule-associated protein-like 2 n=1 Tax=Anguilla rostrata TaxID=7938 RepID=UPI0030D5E36B
LTLFLLNFTSQGHSSFVTHLDWSADSQYIVTNSGDYEILFWEAASGKHLTSADTVRNLEWATSTCVLSFSVFGEWVLTPGAALVCSAPSHVYKGHSSHVTNVAFLHDDSHLISTGGKDMSILQWSVV